jgi:hypothetical protein
VAAGKKGSMFISQQRRSIPSHLRWVSSLYASSSQWVTLADIELSHSLRRQMNDSEVQNLSIPLDTTPITLKRNINELGATLISQYRQLRILNSARTALKRLNSPTPLRRRRASSTQTTTTIRGMNSPKDVSVSHIGCCPCAHGFEHGAE